MPISFVTRYFGRARGGLGRYEEALYPHLEHMVGARRVDIQPLPLPRVVTTLGRLVGRDVAGVARNYPCVIPAKAGVGDIVHLANQTMGLALYLRRRGRWVATVHDIFPYVQRVSSKFRPPPRLAPWDWLLYRLSVRGLACADRLIADSEHTRRDLARFVGVTPDRVDVVPLGVDPDVHHRVEVPPGFYEAYGLRPEHRYLLYVGSQEPRKNLATLFAALAALRSQVPTVRLLVVGAPRVIPRPPVREDPNGGAPGDPWVRFLGFVPEEDLVRLYSLSEALVFPSVYEGFGLPALEAMACGCPVIAARATSLPEVVGDAGCLVDPYDSEAWVEAIGGLLEDRQRRAHMAAAGHERARRYRWESTAAQTVAVYERVRSGGT